MTVPSWSLVVVSPPSWGQTVRARPPCCGSSPAFRGRPKDGYRFSAKRCRRRRSIYELAWATSTRIDLCIRGGACERFWSSADGSIPPGTPNSLVANSRNSKSIWAAAYGTCRVVNERKSRSRCASLNGQNLFFSTSQPLLWIQSRAVLSEDLDYVLESHRLLSRGLDDGVPVPRGATVLEERRTTREITYLVRLAMPLERDGWRIERPTLNEIVIAYLRGRRAPSASSDSGLEESGAT